MLYTIGITVLYVCQLGFLFLLNWHTYITHSEILSLLYKLTNNSTCAVMIGFAGLGIGYLLWKRQHVQELRDRYFQESLKATIKEINTEHEKILSLRINSGQEDLARRLDRLESKYIEISGDFDTYSLLLESLNDKRILTLLQIRSEHEQKYNELTTGIPPILEDKYFDKYMQLRKNTNLKLLKFVKSERR